MSGDVEAAWEALYADIRACLGNTANAATHAADHRPAIEAAIRAESGGLDARVIAEMRQRPEFRFAATSDDFSAEYERLAEDAGGWAGPWPDDEQEDTGAEA